MKSPRPSGPKARAHTVRTSPHVHAHREDKKPPKADHTAAWPAWTNDVVLSDALPPEESAIVSAIERIGRPVTAGELAFLSWEIQGISSRERNAALEALVSRGVIDRREVSRPLAGSYKAVALFVCFGFPEHFEEGGIDEYPHP